MGWNILRLLMFANCLISMLNNDKTAPRKYHCSLSFGVLSSDGQLYSKREYLAVFQIWQFDDELIWRILTLEYLRTGMFLGRFFKFSYFVNN